MPATLIPGIPGKRSWQVLALHYFLAALFTVGTFYGRTLFGAFANRPLLILYIVPIALSASIGGLGPGLFATLLSAVGTAGVARPIPSFSLSQGIDLLQWLLSWGIGVMISILNEALRRSTRRGAEAEYLRSEMGTRKREADALRAAIQARDDFLSVASHELKTPLTSLKLQAQLFERRIGKGDPAATDPASVRLFSDQLNKQITHVTYLINDMLDVSRIQAGKLAIHPEPTLLGDVVREAYARLLTEADEAGTTVTLDCDRPIEGQWDHFRLEQAVVNLLSNAIRYGGGTPVTIGIEKRGDRARLYVRDRGKGIAKENQERIFDRFERAISPNEIAGMGLGLFITREIIEKHGGKIWVESEVNQGATFLVELPLSTASPGAET